VANSDFQTHLHLSYTFSEDGTSQVIQKYTLTNLSSDSAVNSYEFDILDALPTNLHAYDKYGKLSVKMLNSGTSTQKVLVPFSHITAGKGKTFDFYISFTGPTLTRVDGLWKVSFPVPDVANSINTLSAQLTVPSGWGKLLSLNTQIATASANSKTQTVHFSQNQLTNGTIFAVYGQKQVIGFRIPYEFKPPRNSFYIPADDPHQIIFIQDIFPARKNVTLTSDNRWQVTLTQKGSGASVSGFALVENGSTLSGAPNETVISNLASIPTSQVSQIEIIWQKPWQITPFVMFPSRIQIFNSGSQAVYHIPIQINSSDLSFSPGSVPNIPIIPPFGSVTIPITLKSSLLPAKEAYQVAISAGNSGLTYNLDSNYFIFWYVLLVIFITAALVAIAKITHHSWGLHFQKRRAKAGPLHR